VKVLGKNASTFYPICVLVNDTTIASHKITTNDSETKMENWQIGVFTSVGAGLGLDLDLAGEMGLPTIQLHTPPKGQRDQASADKILATLKPYGISITAVFGGFEGESYGDVIALHLGFVPHDTSDPTYQDIIAVTRQLCEYAAKNGQALHLETGQETAEGLVAFISDTKCDNLFVNFDPANMILYGAGEPIEAVEKIGGLIKSVHCKDAKWAASPGQEWGEETKLGDGDVGMKTFLQTLQKIGYTGPLTIEREIPQTPEKQLAEIGHAVNLLKQLKQELL